MLDREIQIAAPSDIPSRDSLGCSTPNLTGDAEIVGNDIRLYHKSRYDHRIGQVRTQAADRGHLVGISLANGHTRRLIRTRTSETVAYNAGSFYIRSFEEDFKADVDDFDFLLMEWPSSGLRRLADEAGFGSAISIEAVSAGEDQTLLHIARAMLPCFSVRDRSDRLLVDQLALAAQIHIIGRYSSRAGVETGQRRMLTRRQESIAKEMLASDLRGRLSIGAIASACGLSESYFIRAFRGTTGLTPHRWLTSIRVARARELLEQSRKPIADIAVDCGFGDQSHFTRVFTQVTGSPPGAWRRQQDGDMRMVASRR